MADPRAAVSHEGVGWHAETYPHDATIVYDAEEEGGSAQVGLAVTLEGSQTVSLVGDGENVLGKLVKVEQDGFCVVQEGGNMTLPGGDGAVLTEGFPIVGDLGVGAVEGYIQVASSAAHALVARGIIKDSSDATAVVVGFPTGN
jgi:hypothetical protein